MSGPQLARRLGTTDAVVLGLSAMLGAGIFAALAPAAQVAGTGLLLGLALASAVAFCNALSSAQLAAQYPTSGGSYVYGRERLGAWPGFLAGWGFVIGKTASCAAMALTFAAYAVPGGPVRPVAVAAVLALAGINHLGVTRTARVSRVLLAFVLVSLAVVVVASLAGGQAHVDRLGGAGSLLDDGLPGVLQSAGLLFFAFAGYARITTLAEEVRDPERTIPRAVVAALGLALIVYLVVAVAVLSVLGDRAVANRRAPVGARMPSARTLFTTMTAPA